MAIKVMLGATENTQQEKPFPKLMKDKYFGDIFYFSRYGYGLPLTYKKGKTVTADGWNMNNFADYNEPITIQNL